MTGGAAASRGAQTVYIDSCGHEKPGTGGAGAANVYIDPGGHKSPARYPVR